jgi:hypothetical protein
MGTMELDPETRAFLQDRVGEEHQVPEPLRSRLSGETVSDLRADAQALAKQLGIAPPAPERGRDQAGRFATASGGMSAVIRRAAGLG